MITHLNNVNIFCQSRITRLNNVNIFCQSWITRLNNVNIFCQSRITHLNNVNIFCQSRITHLNNVNIFCQSRIHHIVKYLTASNKHHAISYSIICYLPHSSTNLMREVSQYILMRQSLTLTKVQYLVSQRLSAAFADSLQALVN